MHFCIVLSDTPTNAQMIFIIKKTGQFYIIIICAFVGVSLNTKHSVVSQSRSVTLLKAETKIFSILPLKEHLASKDRL
jgi:hypothetical protein